MSAWSEGRPIYRRLPEESEQYQGNAIANALTLPIDQFLIALKTAVDRLEQDFLNPETCRADALDWLAQYYGFIGEYWDAGSWTEAQKRTLLKDAYTFIWVNKGRRELLEYFFEVFAIPAKYYQVGSWIAGVTKAGGKVGGDPLNYYILMPFSQAGYLRTSYEWKLVEKLNRLFMPCFTRSRVQYGRWIAGFSVAGDAYFDPPPYP